MNQDKLKEWIAEEIAISNRNRNSMEPWERGFRAGLEGLNREITKGTFNEEEPPCEQETKSTP